MVLQYIIWGLHLVLQTSHMLSHPSQKDAIRSYFQLCPGGPLKPFSSGFSIHECLNSQVLCLQIRRVHCTAKRILTWWFSHASHGRMRLWESLYSGNTYMLCLSLTTIAANSARQLEQSCFCDFF